MWHFKNLGDRLQITVVRVKAGQMKRHESTSNTTSTASTSAGMISAVTVIAQRQSER